MTQISDFATKFIIVGLYQIFIYTVIIFNKRNIILFLNYGTVNLWYLFCSSKCAVRVRRANTKSNLVRPRGLLSQRTGLCQLGKYAGCVAKGVHPAENGQNRRSGEPGPSRASVNTYGLMSGP